eukprot:10644623-Alexandrium_andersonii.AAC.1
MLLLQEGAPLLQVEVVLAATWPAQWRRIDRRREDPEGQGMKANTREVLQDCLTDAYTVR